RGTRGDLMARLIDGTLRGSCLRGFSATGHEAAMKVWAYAGPTFLGSDVTPPDRFSASLTAAADGRCSECVCCATPVLFQRPIDAQITRDAGSSSKDLPAADVDAHAQHG